MKRRLATASPAPELRPAPPLRSAPRPRPAAPRASRGETLVETLAAILVSAVALSVLLVSVLSASRVANVGTQAMRDYYADARTLVTAYEGDEGVRDGTVSVVLLHDDARAGEPTETEWFTSDVRYYETDDAGDRKIVSYISR